MWYNQKVNITKQKPKNEVEEYFWELGKYIFWRGGGEYFGEGSTWVRMVRKDCIWGEGLYLGNKWLHLGDKGLYLGHLGL